MRILVKNFLLLLVLPLLLTGCMSLGGGGKKILVPQKEQIVVMPPAILFTCPDIPKFPEGTEYTQRDVAELVIELYRSGKLCKDNLEAVQKYLLKAREIIEGK